MTSGRESTNSIGNTELHQALIGAPTRRSWHRPGAAARPRRGLEPEPACDRAAQPDPDAATGQDPLDYAQEKLFAPIGATNTTMTKNGTASPG